MQVITSGPLTFPLCPPRSPSCTNPSKCVTQDGEHHLLVLLLLMDQVITVAVTVSFTTNTASVCDVNSEKLHDRFSPRVPRELYLGQAAKKFSIHYLKVGRRVAPCPDNAPDILYMYAYR
jgi:hypothetical protein